MRRVLGRSAAALAMKPKVSWPSALRGNASSSSTPPAASGGGHSAPLAAGAAAAVAALVTFARTGSLCEAEPSLLRGKRDHYGGVIVDPKALPADAMAFERSLDNSIEEWKADGVRGVWLQVPIDKSNLISLAVERQFTFHHAEQDYCMLTRWLPDTPCPLPPNASHQVGVGALCVNEDGNILLVQEAVGPSARRFWKIPTGLLHAGEDIKDGVERELLEETGIHGTFEKVLTFRHGHAAPWGKSDLFFICLVRARSSGPFVLQEAEIAKARWAPFAEFLEQSPYPRDTPVWAKAYGSCIGPDGVVGNVGGIRVEQCSKAQKNPGEAYECVYY